MPIRPIRRAGFRSLLALLLLGGFTLARDSEVLGGISSQGISSQGISSQGISSQGISSQGISSQGISSQGISSQGISSQGISSQGISSQGVSLMGADIPATELKGVALYSIEVRGTNSTDTSKPLVELTSVPGMSTGSGNYISVGGQSAVGHYAVATMADANGDPIAPPSGCATDPNCVDPETLDLYIAGEMKDLNSNLFHNVDQQDNQDELYTVYFFHKWSGQWVSLCPYDGHTESASAMALPEDPSQPNKFIFACTANGVASKCARNWGYRPWANTSTWLFKDGGLGTGDWIQDTEPLKPYYDACKVGARAAYCQDEKSFTKNGTLVDLFDTRQIIWPNAVENPFNPLNDDSLWMMAQEYFVSSGPDPHDPRKLASALQRTRYRELSPSGECDQEFANIDRLEHDNIEDGRWASPLTNTPRIQIFSPTACTHNEQEAGDALPWDCSPCTTQVCKQMPECCGAGLSAGWSPACVMQASATCRDGSTSQPWRLAKVWPRDLPGDAPPVAPAKYLLGAGGAVVNVTGVSTTTTSAIVSGWACDPEWSGATVPVQIFSGPRELGGRFLAEVRADQALAAPLASEVSAACDGAGRNYAQHGFSYAVPMGQKGNVFVYAIDLTSVDGKTTDDGPTAPPTLVRNGIVHLPTCAHSEHVTGTGLDNTCSTCAATVCDVNHGTPSCCNSIWDASCTIAAESCSPDSTSAAADSYAFAAVATGWIEAPSDGTYRFESLLQPSRLWVNGQELFDSWPGSAAPSTGGQIDLRAGIRYHLRWDRYQSQPLSTGAGLTWRPPGQAGQSSIPAGRLYLLAPGSGTGLAATYTPITFSCVDPLAPCGVPVSRTDPFIDINTYVAPPSQPRLDLPSNFTSYYSGVWEGELVPSFSEGYYFYVVGSGDAVLTVNGTPMTFPSRGANPPSGSCAHSVCDVGDKLAQTTAAEAVCDPCVDTVCKLDAYCCNGGYLSYYSTEPTWDAKCVAEANLYCHSAGCTSPPPSKGPPQLKSGNISLEAGVHYPIKLEYTTAGLTGTSGPADKTIRLLWSSARQAKQVIPQFALYPKGVAPTGAGAGLNVTYFGTKTVGGILELDTARAAGATSDPSLTPTVGQLGIPSIDALAPEADVAAWRLPPPTIMRPRYGDEISPSDPTQLPVKGIGGVPGSWIDIVLSSDGGATFGSPISAPVDTDGTFNATVSVGGPGSWTLGFVQRPSLAATCAGEPRCSYQITWPVTLVAPTAPIRPLNIVSPRDPTYSPNPADNVFSVVGNGTSGPVTISENGSNGAGITTNTVTAAPDGTISGSLTLTAAVPGGDPNLGWHKLVFTQTGGPSPLSKSVFVSVGVRPPTVTYPRTGAELGTDPKCAGDGTGWDGRVEGTTPYSPAQFGNVVIAEETGRGSLRFPTDTNGGLEADPRADGLYHFQIQTYGFGEGKHALYVFQAPPPTGATPADRDAHYRAFASIAATPNNRFEVNIPPRRFAVPPDAVENLGAGGTGGSLFGIGLPPTAGPLAGSVPIQVDCVPGAVRGPLCADANADVNVKIGPRVFTKRADVNGSWAMTVQFLEGWNEIIVSQVDDSVAGGAWSESCPSNPIELGIPSPNAPFVRVPNPGITLDATSPSGAPVPYAASAVTNPGGVPVPVHCSRPSGATFPIGTTVVLCTATDPDTHAIGLGSFTVTVVPGPPVLQGPTGITAEATSAMGAMVSYDVTATDGSGAPLPVNCAPSSPAQFPLSIGGMASYVSCVATDASGRTKTLTFPVLVVDTTPPVLNLPASIVVNGGASGAVVAYTATATDLVSGTFAATCLPASGSTFLVGTTTVNCSALDAAGNEALPGSFKVTVINPNTPPVVTVPDNVTVEATCEAGAKVTFVASASDAQDGPLTPTCSPASGTIFAIGTKTVTCTAKDTGGLVTSKSFTVTVADTTAPVFSNVPGTVTAYATSTGGAKVSYTKPTATDAVDRGRAVTCTPASGAQFPVNKTTVTCSASDTRGHTGHATFTVWVTYQAPTDGTFFLVPIRANGTSIFRIGLPVPARFRLAGASAGIGNLSAKLVVTKLSSTIQGTIVDTSDETVDDTDFTFKYRPLLKFYAYRWRTRDQTQGTYQLRADLGDGVVHQVNVSLKP